MAFGKKDASPEVSLIQFTREKMTVRLVGVTPIILYRMSEKAKRELLLPKAAANRAARSQSLKHDPIAEFRESPYRLPPGSPALLCHLATAFKASMRNCAVDMPGSSKAQIGRMLYVEGERVAVYGVPKLHMAITKQAGISKAPDVRTRCIVPEWAAELSVVFMRPHLTLDNVANLIAGAGLMQGVGDWRPEKGSGTFGQYRLVDWADKADRALYERIVRTGGYDAQQAAMDAPVAYDDEAEEMLAWFGTEVSRRQLKVVGTSNGNGKKANVSEPNPFSE